jgi:indolepyruvate ferredoxin oxidoreductase alpha subunit
VRHGFELSEASNSVVMMEVRIRSCHVHGSFIARDNQRPKMTVAEALAKPMRDTQRIVLPPASFLHEKEKIEHRWPAAVDYIRTHKINELFGPSEGKIGIVMQGGMYNGVVRALQRLGLADIYGETQVPLYVLNAVYPLVDDEFLAFSAGKDAVLVVEEGQPNHIEQALGHMLHQAGRTTRLAGKDFLPMAGEYTGQVMLDSIGAFIRAFSPELLPDRVRAPNTTGDAPDLKDLARAVPGRPPSFCTGCPERPIFAATKLVEQELGQHHIASDIGCHLFSIMPPFELGATTMGYGLGPASASAFNAPDATRRSISFVGDGGFWHNGVASSIGNAVFNKHDGVVVVVDNFYSAATGGQDILSSRANNRSKSTKHAIADAVKGMGVKWVRQIDRTYDVAKVRAALTEALTTEEKGPKVIVASSECMLNRQRRERPLMQKAIAGGARTVKPRFGVDEDVCTGDHACIRLSGCPSLSVKTLDDPLRDDPVAAIDHTCVGCGNCGEVAEAAVLCPSFYRADTIYNPTGMERRLDGWRRKAIGWLQAHRQRRRLTFAEA